MTDERKNEIWAFLTPEEKAKYSKEYQEYQPPTEDDWDDWDSGYAAALNNIFGKHNLTAQAEEKSKEPGFKVGDKVVVFSQLATIFKVHEHGYDVVFHGGYELFNIPESDIEPHTEPKVEETVKEREISEKFPIDYAQYRLDLAKEIVVAMINNTGNTRYDDILPYAAVKISNEIVKRLKETDNAD